MNEIDCYKWNCDTGLVPAGVVVGGQLPPQANFAGKRLFLVDSFFGFFIFFFQLSILKHTRLNDGSHRAYPSERGFGGRPFPRHICVHCPYVRSVSPNQCNYTYEWGISMCKVGDSTRRELEGPLPFLREVLYMPCSWQFLLSFFKAT